MEKYLKLKIGGLPYLKVKTSIPTIINTKKKHWKSYNNVILNKKPKR